MSGQMIRTMRFATMIISLLAVFSGHGAKAEDWPCWRGVHKDGISRETGLLKEWPKDGPRQLWKVELSGGFSAVAVAGGKVFTQTKAEDQEIVLCFDAGTGKENWRYAYDCDYAAHPTFTGGGAPKARTGPRATPVVDGDCVYTLGATGILLCLEANTGKRIWRQDILKVSGHTCPVQGYCGSPLIVGQRIFVQPGGVAGQVDRSPG